VRQEARRKRHEEREKRAQRATGAAEGDDAPDTQGVILIATERTNPSDSDGMTARFTFSYRGP